MTIALGCDHGGLCLKNAVLEYLKNKGIETRDMGAFESRSCDYADYALPVCSAVLSGEAAFGMLFCGTGIGMSIAANKIRGIRCAVLGDVFSAKATRSHNDANVLAMGERVIGVGLALEIIDAFLETDYSREPRHQTRIDKISKLEER